MSEFAVRRVRISDVDQVRSIRLESLGDPVASIAFLGNRDRAMAQPMEFWRERTAAVALSGSAAQFIAESGRDWLGTATVLMPEPGAADESRSTGPLGTARLVAVYVRPSHRGGGILEAIVDAAAEWARDAGEGQLALDVHQENARAQRAYARLGFTATGRTSDGPNGTELEMVRAVL